MIEIEYFEEVKRDWTKHRKLLAEVKGQFSFLGRTLWGGGENNAVFPEVQRAIRLPGTPGRSHAHGYIRHTEACQRTFLGRLMASGGPTMTLCAGA
jgi:hypothetical protein